jgi:hypothetical protein
MAIDNCKMFSTQHSKQSSIYQKYWFFDLIATELIRSNQVRCYNSEIDLVLHRERDKVQDQVPNSKKTLIVIMNRRVIGDKRKYADRFRTEISERCFSLLLFIFGGIYVLEFVSVDT